MEANQSRTERGDDGMEGSIGERVDRVGGDVQEAVGRTRDAWYELKEFIDLKGRIERNPYGTVLAAVGIGYVLGGGIFSRLTSRLLGTGLRLGIRLAAVPFLMDEVLGMLGIGAAPEEASASGSSAQRPG